MFIFLLQVSAMPEHIWQLTKNLYVNRVSDYELRKTTFPYDEYTDKFNTKCSVSRYSNHEKNFKVL